MPAKGQPSPAAIDMAGVTVGTYRVLGIAGHSPGRVRRWRCLCDPERGGCGTERDVRGSELRAAQRAGESIRCRVCVGKSHAARQAAAGHTGPGGRLTRPVWGRTCRVCGSAFRGTARQVYCSPRCAAVAAVRRRINAHGLTAADLFPTGA